MSASLRKELPLLGEELIVEKDEECEASRIILLTMDKMDESLSAAQDARKTARKITKVSVKKN